MPFYTLKILNKNGEIEEFCKEYIDINALKNDIRQNSNVLINFREKKDNKRYLLRLLNSIRDLFSSKTIKDEDIYNLFYELGIILKSGVPVMRAIKIISGEINKEVLKKFLEQAIFKLKGGKSFSDILDEGKKFYNFKGFIPIIKMGEKTGNLGGSFLQISLNLERWIKIKNEIVNALIYPFLLICTSLVAIYIMLVYVIPRFEGIVKSFKVVLPFHTLILFKLSIFLNNNQQIILVTGILILLLVLIFIRNSNFKRFLNELTYKIPVVKNIKFSSESIHFLSSFSNLLSGGVPILESINLASESFTSEEIRNILRKVSLSLRKGELLADSIKEAGIFPEIIPNMLRVGEESGNLPEVLNELYNLFSERYLKKTKRLMNFLEPMVIIFIAIFIGFLIMSILPIIMNLSDITF